MRGGRRSFVPLTMAPDSRLEAGKTGQTRHVHERFHTRKNQRRWLVTAVQLVHRDRSLTIGKAISRR